MLPEQVVRVVTIPTADFEDVAKAPRREQPDDCAAAGQERVQPDGRAVKEVLRCADPLLRNRGSNRGEDAVLRGRRRRRLLADTGR